MGMRSYILIPGAGTDSWYWQPLASELRDRGQDAVPVDLPCADPAAGLPEYADAVAEAIGERERVVVVAHSFGGFTAPLVCDRVPVELLVLVTAMIPAPGEPPGDWWANTRHRDAGVGEHSDLELYYHDVPGSLAQEAMRHELGQSDAPLDAPWPRDAWPDVPTRFLLCTEDRCFPAPFMRRVVRERLGVVPDEIATGHHPMLARPQELADRLVAYPLG
jgi:pimeloyl-ACP methyl ester carboxylesterase